jgi:hypothetical protein
MNVNQATSRFVTPPADNILVSATGQEYPVRQFLPSGGHQARWLPW